MRSRLVERPSWMEKSCQYNTTVGHLLYLREEGVLRIPDFQRPLGWSKNQNIQFIESLVSDLPIGVYVLHESQDLNEYIVLDGQQRMSAIIDFVDGKFSVFGFTYPDCSIQDKRKFLHINFPHYLLRGLSHDEQKDCYLRMAYGGTAHDPSLNPFKEAAS